jgi:DNA processing protein
MLSKVDKGSADYPNRLMTMAHSPATLWFAGRLPVQAGKALAVVGSRAAGLAGITRARDLAFHAASRGWAVISGGAYGIDAAAHEGALDAGAPTFAVLGCGADVTYPDRHEDLFHRIRETGGLLSEYPPGTQPRKGQFPARNRLIVALSDAVIVVEAARRSGALITAGIAARRGCPVFAVPGSSGTDALLNAGRAFSITEIGEVEDALGGKAMPDRSVVRHLTPVPSRLVELVAAVSARPGGADELSRRLTQPIAAVLVALTEAEIEGFIRRGPGGQYEVRRGN